MIPRREQFLAKEAHLWVPARNRLTTRNYFLKCLGFSTELASKKSGFAIWKNHALYSPSAAQSSSEEVYKLQFCFHSYFIIYYYNVFLDTVAKPVSNFHLIFQITIKKWNILVHSATFFLHLYTIFPHYFHEIGKLHVSGWWRIYFASFWNLCQSFD